MAKSTNAELEMRVNKVYELLINSWNRYDILQYVRKNWDIEDKQADNYIAKAKEIIKENAKQTQEEWLEDTKNKLQDLYKKAMSQKQTRECRQIIVTANKVLGYEKLSIDANINGVIMVSKEDEKL